jgi:dipeptidyl-peptidase-4
MRTSRRLAVGLVVWSASYLAAFAQGQKQLTLDELYDPAKRVSFGSPVAAARSGYEWLNDAEYVGTRQVNGGVDHIRVNAVTGLEAPLFDAARLATALRAVPGMTPDEAGRLSRQRTYVFAPGRTALLVTVGDDLFHWAFDAGRLTRLTSTPGLEDEVTFSPDGRLVAFVRAHNLHVVDLEGRERALTTDGHSQLLNGRLDWVYQEEIYGRGTHRAYWWSPDSSRISFLQLDEAAVPEFAVVDHIPYRQEVEITDYPKAGDPNPTVKLGVVKATGGDVLWVDTSKYGATDHLIVNVDWTLDSREVVFQVQNREQTWLDLNLGSAAKGATSTILRETSPAWVSELGSPRWLKDGTFLWLSERDGWQHLYRYRRDGTLVGRVTSGEWECDTVYGVDETGGYVYFAGTERSHIGRDVYRVKLDGSRLTRLTERAGTTSASFNPRFSMFVGTWSDVSTPHQARLHNADGSEVRVIDANDVPAFAEYRLSTPEFVQVGTKDGFTLEAMLIKPVGFDPSRKYPVYQHTYAGPHAPQVRNAWGGTTMMYHQLLAQRGIAVWVCDNRSASGKGAQSAWVAYKRLGETELADIEECLDYLKQQPWVDPSRIGINGWSYGGFMVSYALTHSKSFAMGIAGGSVTDWRDYDSIYTERFMLLPQNNPDGYARTAPRHAAKNLHGELLLLHGLMDDNVHVQNAIQFAYELQKAGKPFEMMLYPKSRHGVTDPQLMKHMREKMLEFTLRTLKPDSAAAGTR